MALAALRLISTRSVGRLRLAAKGEGTHRSFSIQFRVPRPAAARIEAVNRSLRIEPDTVHSLNAKLGNGKVTSDGFSPRADHALEVPNGTISPTGFAPEAPCRLEVINGELDLATKTPIRLELSLTNGILELAGQRSQRVAGSLRQTVGPEKALPSGSISRTAASV